MEYTQSESGRDGIEVWLPDKKGPTIYFVSTLSENLRQFWSQSYPDIYDWYIDPDKQAHLYVGTSGVNGILLVKM